MRPNNVVTIVSVAADVAIGILFLASGNVLGTVLAIAGSVIPVVGVDVYENRRLGRRVALNPTLSPIDYAEAQELNNQGKFGEALRLMIRRAYPMLSDKDIRGLRPEQVKDLIARIKAA